MDPVVELRHGGGEVDEPAEKEAAGLNYFGSKREVAYQRQEFPLSACLFVLPHAEKVGESSKLLCGKPQHACLGVNLDAKKGDGSGRAKNLVEGERDTEVAEER